MIAIICARCTVSNHSSTRFCTECGLPLGSLRPDAEAGADALGPYEAPDATDPDTPRLMRELVERSGYEAGPSGHGWRMVVHHASPMPETAPAEEPAPPAHTLH